MTDQLQTYYPPNYQIKKYKPRGLNDKQIAFCEAFIAGENASYSAKLAGYKSPKRAGGYLLRCKRVIDYIDQQRKRTLEIPVTIEYKMERLKHVVDEFIPLTPELNVNQVKVGIAAISEMNKVQGHYAPEKSINMNVNTDVNEAKELMNRLEKEHKSEY